MKYTLYVLVALALIGLALAKPAEETPEKGDSPPKEAEQKPAEKPNRDASDKAIKGATQTKPRSAPGVADQASNIVRGFVAIPESMVEGGLDLAGGFKPPVVRGFSDGLRGVMKPLSNGKKE